jgi:hypothetical protein
MKIEGHIFLHDKNGKKIKIQGKCLGALFGQFQFFNHFLR